MTNYTKRQTVTVQDIIWKVKCSMCDYEQGFERPVGASIGDVFDMWLISYLTECPKCGGIGIGK